MATASAAYRHEWLFKAAARKKQWLGRNIHRLDFSSSRQPRDACLGRSGGDCLPELSHMPAMVAEKLPAKNRWRPWRLWPDSRLRRERGPRIEARHNASVDHETRVEVKPVRKGHPNKLPNTPTPAGALHGSFRSEGG